MSVAVLPPSMPHNCAECSSIPLQDLARSSDNALMELSSLDQDVKLARQLIVDITKAGAEIYEGLGHEAELKEARQHAVAKQADKLDVERAVQARFGSDRMYYEVHVGQLFAIQEQAQRVLEHQNLHETPRQPASKHVR